MEDKIPEYPDMGIRTPPDIAELEEFEQAADKDGGMREISLEAQNFADRFSGALTQYPKAKKLPNWVRAMVEKKVSVEELTQTLHDRISRAPSHENLEMALLLANEIARMKGGSEALAKHLTEEFLSRLKGENGEAK